MKEIFHKTSLRLSALYVLVLMIISLGFSFGLYRLSVDELGRGLIRQIDVVRGPLGRGIVVNLPPNLDKNRLEVVEEAKRRITARLIAVNIIILAGGSVASYYLARRTLRPIQEAHETLERFTADASHELRTPITAMHSEIEVALMQSKISEKDARKILTSSLDELDKLTNLSTSLLNLAKLSGQSLQKAPLSVKDITDLAANKVKSEAEKKNISINSKVKPDIHVEGDKTLLVEALSVIIDNAVKYSPPKTKVTLEAKKIAKHVEIKIIDQGLGISEIDQERIFERFYRADSSRNKQKIDGFGLGLSLAKEIVEKHGGNISVNSKPEKGSTFTVALPV